MLNAISAVLEELAKSEVKMEAVSYGASNLKKYDEASGEYVDLDKINLFVFNRLKTVKSANGCDIETYYQVIIFHEDFIHEGYVNKVKEKLEKLRVDGKRLKLTSDPIDYDYTIISKTNKVVEIATLTFVHPEKRC